MISFFATVKAKPEFREKFIEAILGDARGSVENEPECYRFDVLQDESDPNRIHLYGVFADKAALDAHGRAPHYLKFLETARDWFDGGVGHIQMINCTTVFPSDEGWRRQKPHFPGQT